MIRPAAAAPKARPVVHAERPKARPVVHAEQDRSLQLGARGLIGHQVDLWFTLKVTDSHGHISSRDGYLALRSLQRLRELDPGFLPLDNFGMHVMIRIGEVGD